MSDNTKTRDELTFIELLAEHVFDPSSITETSEDVNILELSEYSTGVPYSGSVTTRSAPSHPLEEPSLVHNNSLMDVEPATESVEVEEEKTEPVTEPIVDVEEQKVAPVTEPIVEVEEEKTEPVTEPIVEVEEEKTEPVTEPIVEVEEEKTESVTELIVDIEEKKTETIAEPVKVEETETIAEPVKVEEQKVEPVKVEEVKVDETPVVEEPKGVFNKLTSSLFSICNWFVKK